MTGKRNHTLRVGEELAVVQWQPFFHYRPRVGGVPSNRYRLGGIIVGAKLGPIVVHFEMSTRARRFEVHRDRPQGPHHMCGWTRGMGFRKTDYMPGGRFHRDV